MNNNDSSNRENSNKIYNFHNLNNNKSDDNEEDSESIIYYEHGAHFRYKDLYNNLLKLRNEREKEEEKEKGKEENRLINNNIIINNNLNVNLFNNNKHKIISRNIQMNNNLNNINNINFFENSNITNTFISNISNRKLNKTAMLPSTEIVQQNINNYLQDLANNKLIIDDNTQNLFPNKNNKIIEINYKNHNINENSNIKNNTKIINNNIIISNKNGKNIINQKINKKNKSPDNNTMNLKKIKII